MKKLLQEGEYKNGKEKRQKTEDRTQSRHRERHSRRTRIKKDGRKSRNQTQLKIIENGC